jgi:hypothetical protein
MIYLRIVLDIWQQQIQESKAIPETGWEQAGTVVGVGDHARLKFIFSFLFDFWLTTYKLPSDKSFRT